jgi:hypothetical protein
VELPSKAWWERRGRHCVDRLGYYNSVHKVHGFDFTRSHGEQLKGHCTVHEALRKTVRLRVLHLGGQHFMYLASDSTPLLCVLPQEIAAGAAAHPGVSPEKRAHSQEVA